MTVLHFPAGFLWGCATSAHQVEGGNSNNQWADWERRPGAIWRGQTSGDACGWWRDAEQDIVRAAALGQNAHRLSIEWSRIEPESGVFDISAIERYRQILGALRQHGITPMVSLHHFTNPRWVEAQGGWLSAQTPLLFARYVRHVLGVLGDLCTLWCTINEPNIVAVMGYLFGIFPPGRQDLLGTRRVLAQLLRGHALAVAEIRRAGPQHRVGLVHHLRIFDPAQDTPQDTSAAATSDRLFNGVVLEAIASGRLMVPFGTGGELPGMRGSCDFIGLNYYTRERVAFDATRPQELFARRSFTPGVPTSDLGRDGRPYGEIYPEGIGRALRRVGGLGLPVYVTEFGLPDADDHQRPNYIRRTLVTVHQALASGIDVRGVFHWTLVDNFEWAEGWKLRFGLLALDEQTGVRTPRRSASLYASYARANAVVDEL